MTAVQAQVRSLVFLQAHHPMWSTTAACAVVVYLIIVRALRYRRRDRIVASLSKTEIQDMMPATAQKIFLNSLHYDNSTIMLLGTHVALFKVFGIVGVRRLLFIVTYYFVADRCVVIKQDWSLQECTVHIEAIGRRKS